MNCCCGCCEWCCWLKRLIDKRAERIVQSALTAFALQNNLTLPTYTFTASVEHIDTSEEPSVTVTTT